MYTKLADTCKGMTSDNFKDRFVAEYWQLKIRYDNLSRMLDNYQKGTLKFTPKSSYNILFTQLVHMRGYLASLEDRACIEGIEL